MSEQADAPTNECIDIARPVPRSSAWEAMRAPWLALLGPSRAAKMMARCGPVAAIASVAAYGALLASAIVGLALFSATLTLEATGKWSTRSELQVWNDWHANTHFGRAEVTFCAVLAGVLILVAVCAWTHLPTVHRAGSISRSYFRAVCAVAACIAVLLVTSLVVGTVFTLCLHDRWGAVFGSPAGSSGIPRMLGQTAVALGACLILWTVGRAVRGVRDDSAGMRIEPRCEECGYDLTHVGPDRRCSECGTDVDLSLAPNRRRPGCVWEERGGLAGWLVTSAAVLVGPKRFYSRLKLRSPVSGPEAFGTWHFVGIGLATGIWVFFLLLSDPPTKQDREAMILIPLMLASCVSCLAWGMRRLVAAIAGSWLLHTRAVVDFGWVGRIVQYESAYLWLFCAFNGLGITLSFAIPGLAGAMRFQRAFFWMPLGPALLIFGNIALGLCWLWRYRIAARAVRWSNF